MKFLIASHHTPWTVGVSCKRALEQLGCQADTFYLNASTNIVEKAINGIRPRIRNISSSGDKLWEKIINKKLIKKVKDSNPDVLFVIRGEELYAETLERIKDEHKIRIITWWTESRLEHKYYVESLPLYDFVFSFDKSHISKMKEYGARDAYYLPLACDPEIHRSIVLSAKEKKLYEHDISSCGAINLARIDVFKTISDFDFAIWGKDWPRIIKREGLLKNFKGVIKGEDVARVYNASKIALNVHHPDTISGANARTFEIPACGILEIVDYKSSIEELFVVGKEIICYKDKRELRDLIRYYLSHNEERIEIAKRGYERVHKEHRYLDRMQKVLSVLK